MIKVSIVIPVYKVELYIERCINSVLCQTYRNLEVIVVDDCTPDRSIEIAQNCICESGCNDLDFIFLKHEYNRGLSAARNTGTYAAKGEYIYYLDSDDEIIPKCIEKLIEAAINHPGVEIVQGHRTIISRILHKEIAEHMFVKDIDFIDDNNRIRQLYFSIGGTIPPNAWNKLIKIDFIRFNSLYFKEGILYEDMLWVFNVVKKLRTYCVVKEKTYIYYITPNSITSSTPCYTSVHNWGIILDEVTNNFDEPFYDEQVAYYLLHLIKHFDNNKEGKHIYRRLAKKYGAILFKRNHFHLFLLLIVYVYSLPINKWRRGKWRLMKAIQKIRDQDCYETLYNGKDRIKA